MASGPESNFWKNLRDNLPKNCHATRIESKHGGGIPDCHLVWEGISFWLELKVEKTNKVNLRPHQIAWNARHWACGGLNFYLVRALKSKELLLFEGYHGTTVLEQGCLAPCALSCASVPEFWGALRPVLEARAADVLRPAP